MSFSNISSLSNTPCSCSLHQNKIILEFLSRWPISTIFHHRPASEVFFLFIKMRSFYNFPDHDKFQPYFIDDQQPMYFFFSWKWDDFRISLNILNFNNISSLTNVRCSFPFGQNTMTLELLSPRWISTIFYHRPIVDVLFLCVEMRSF